MDWKEQLSALLEGEAQTLDVRIICIKDKEKWFLKRLRATIFHSEPPFAEQICYPSHLFLRRKMSPSDFLQLLSDLTTRSTLSQEELAKLSYEEKLKTFQFNGWDIFCELVNVVFMNHTHGNSRWGLGDYTLPTWNFGGNLSPDLQESQEPLFAHEAKYYPRPIDGQAWYLYGKALQSPNDSLPPLDISIEDDRAYFTSIVIEEDTSTLRCHCEGKLLSQSLIRLYTNPIQVEDKQAENEVIFHLQDHPKNISLALTYGDVLLDRRDMDFAYPHLGIPRDVNIIVKDETTNPTFQEEIANMIATQGESLTLEFKSRLDEGGGIDKNRLLQTAVAFANTNGGTILLGVSNDGQVLGLDPTDTKDTVVRKIDGNVSPVPFFEVIPQEQEGKQIFVIRVMEGTMKPYALMANKNKPQFYIRMDGSNKLAKPEDIRQMFGQQGQANTTDQMSLFRHPFAGYLEEK